MAETIVISTEEYKDLLAKSITLEIVKNYVEASKYVSESDIRILLNAEKKCDA